VGRALRANCEAAAKHPRILSFCAAWYTRPKGVLCTALPGSGKNVLARASCRQKARWAFHSSQRPEKFMRKLYGESEAKELRAEVLKGRGAPRSGNPDSLTRLTAWLPKRAKFVRRKRKSAVWRRWLQLMDGFVSRGQVIVIGGDKTSELVDPGLRRPGPLRSRNRNWACP